MVEYDRRAITYPENAEWERLEPPGTLFPLGPVEEVKDDPWKPPPAFVAPGPNLKPLKDIFFCIPQRLLILLICQQIAIAWSAVQNSLPSREGMRAGRIFYTRG